MMRKLHTKRTKKPHRKFPKILSVDLLNAILDLDKQAVFISRLTSRQISKRVKAYGDKLGFNNIRAPLLTAISIRSSAMELFFKA